MKIVFFINSLTSGGGEKVVVTLLNKLIEKNYQVELICIEKNNFYSLPENLKVTYLEKKNVSNSILKVLQIPLLSLKLKKYVKNNNIDIVHSHLYRANYINVLSQIFGSNHQSQIVNHGIASRYKIKGLLGKINLFLIKSLYSRADKVILISKAMKEDLNKLYNFKNTQLIINNPYDIKNILTLKDELIDNFNFQDDKKYLITMGRLISLKRYKDVISSLKFLDKKIELILLGDGNEKDSLIKLSKKLNLENRTHFLGNVSNPYKYLNKADIFILSSETEGFPNSLIEALACNTSVVSSDCISGPREILAPDTNISIQLKDHLEYTKYGILYPVGDINNLVIAINDSLKKDVVENSDKINRALDFSIEKIISTYIKVLEIE